MNEKFTFVGIVLARMDSNRLPGKALIDINNRKLIGYCFERAKKIRNMDSIILATTDKFSDDPLVEYAKSQGINVYRGQENDVALRIINCLQVYESKYFVRLNGDSPFLEPSLIEYGIDICKNNDYDFITNIPGRTYPYGVSLEIIKSSVYKRLYQEMSTDEEKEHVTQYLYKNLEKIKAKVVVNPHKQDDGVRLVVDTKEDLLNFIEVVNILGFSILDANYIKVVDIYKSLKRN